MKSLLLCLCTLLLFGWGVKVEKSALENVVVNAEVLEFDELGPETQRDELKYASQRYYGPAENWNKGTKFSVETAYYVRATINRKALATATETFGCGSITKARKCSRKKLANNVQKLLEEENHYFLYGKYKNAWKFLYPRGDMPKTDKWDGHKMRLINTSFEQDEVLVGPLPFMPSVLMIKFRNGYKVKGKNYDVVYVLP